MKHSMPTCRLCTHTKNLKIPCVEKQTECAQCLLLLTLPGPLHEVSLHLFLVRAVYVGGNERVAAIIEVRWAVQLQAAVELPLGDVMDPRLDVEPLQHRRVVQEPLELWLGVPWRGDNQALVC